jgi:hypothetical protein
MQLSARSRVTCAAAGIGVLLVTVPAAQTPARPPLPPRLQSYVTQHVKLTSAQQATLAAGQPVSKLLEADASKEVAVFGAVWVNAPAARYVALAKDVEQFEKGPNFRITKKISNPPGLDDFAQLKVPDDDAADIKTCKVGDCEIKLSQAAIERVRREVAWSKPTARAELDQLARTLAFEFTKAYVEGGNAELAVYRDGDRPTFVEKEFTTMIGQLPELTEHLPEMRRYLLEYPKFTPANLESFLYWQETTFGLKPTIRINHVGIMTQPEGAVIASKMLYASHYFWTALELRVLVPDPARGNGFWFVSVNRSRSDGLTGFTGRLIRGKVRGEAEDGTMAILKLTKTKMEGGGR